MFSSDAVFIYSNINIWDSIDKEYVLMASMVIPHDIHTCPMCVAMSHWGVSYTGALVNIGGEANRRACVDCGAEYEIQYFVYRFRRKRVDSTSS